MSSLRVKHAKARNSGMFLSAGKKYGSSEKQNKKTFGSYKVFSERSDIPQTAQENSAQRRHYCHHCL